MKNSFSRIGYEYGIVFPTVIMLYLNINLRIPYRVSYWIFCYRRILVLACLL